VSNKDGTGGPHNGGGCDTRTGRDRAANVVQRQIRYRTRIFTSGTSHIDALRALGVKRFFGATYFRGDINRIYRDYFADAGLDCLDMVGMDVDFDKVQWLPSEAVYRFIADAFHKQPGAEAIYMLGPAWRTLDIIETLERELGVPVVHAVPAQCSDIQRHLGLREPVQGFGRLIAEMPQYALPAGH
jgi:maleate isomerase